MVNYAGDVDLNRDEPPDLPPVEYTDADVPDDAPDFGAPPGFIPATFVLPEPPEWDEPPAEYLPPACVVDLPEVVMEALRESGWLEDVAAVQPQQLTFFDEALAPEAVEILDPASTLDADLADVLAQLERLEANENPIDRAAQQDVLLDQQSQLEQEMDGLATSAPILDAEETVEVAPDVFDPSSPDTTTPDQKPSIESVDDPRAALEADLANVWAQLERLEANENPVERAAQQDALLEQQSALEEELKGLSAPGVDVQKVDGLDILARSAVDGEPLEQPEIPADDIDANQTVPPLDAPGEAAPPGPALENGDVAIPADNVQFLTFSDIGPSFSETPDLEALASSENSALWDQYYAAVMDGQNPGGSELALVQRAEEMNLLDARFVGYSDADGHHVGAVELAVDPATGQEYGQILDVATFEAVNQAAALYYDLEGHVMDNSLPNYAIADFAAFSALSLGNDLAWQQATEQQLALVYEHVAIMPSDEPPVPLMDQLIQEYAGVDLSTYAPESAFEYESEPGDPGLDERLESLDEVWDFPRAEEPALGPEEEMALYEQVQLLPADEPPEEAFDPLIQDHTGVNLSAYAQDSAFEYEPEPENGVQYNIYLDTDLEGKTFLGLAKEWDGGPRAGGGEAYRLVDVYESVQNAQSVAQDLVNLRHDIAQLAGNANAGEQMMASMAYEIGLTGNTIQPGEQLFVDLPLNAPADPFEIQPTQELFAQYEAMQKQIEVDEEPTQQQTFGPDLDL